MRWAETVPDSDRLCDRMSYPPGLRVSLKENQFPLSNACPNNTVTASSEEGGTKKRRRGLLSLRPLSPRPRKFRRLLSFQVSENHWRYSPLFEVIDEQKTQTKWVHKIKSAGMVGFFRKVPCRHQVDRFDPRYQPSLQPVSTASRRPRASCSLWSEKKYIIWC